MAGAAVLWLWVAGSAAARPLNIDFGTSFGTPSSAYGAASAQAGTWNEAGLGATALVDVSGAATAASVTVTATANGNTAHDGDDDALLLADNVYGFNTGWSAELSGLVPGAYLVYLYAPSNGSVPTGEMTVGGEPVSSLPGSPDSELIEGTSWVAVAADAGDGTLSISGTDPGPFEGVAGLQLVPYLPAPPSLLYQETIAGETSYPTSPEIDLIAGGGLAGHPDVVLDGTVSHLSLDAADVGLFLGHFLASPAPGQSVLELRGDFDDFAHSGPTGFGQAVLLVDDPNAETLFAAVSFPGDQTGLSPLLSVSTGVSNATQVDLTDAVADAILAGDPFRVDLVLDLPGDGAQACVAVAGAGRVCTPVLSPALQGTAPDLFLAGGRLGNGQPSDTLALDMTRFELRGDVAPPDVPAAGVLARAALVALLVLVGARRISRATA